MQNLNQHKKKFWTNKKLFTLSVIAFIPFVLMTLGLFFEWNLIDQLDLFFGTRALDWRAPFLTSFFSTITIMGNVSFVTGVVIVVAILLLFIEKDWRLSLWYILTVALGAGLLNQLAKHIILRARPDETLHLITQGGYSFPSGHAMGSMITYGAIIFLFFRLSKSKFLNWVFGIVFAILILLIGTSRVYVGVHFPSDIIGGYSMGATWLILCMICYFKVFETSKFRGVIYP